MERGTKSKYRRKLHTCYVLMYVEKGEKEREDKSIKPMR